MAIEFDDGSLLMECADAMRASELAGEGDATWIGWRLWRSVGGTPGSR